MPFNDLNSKVEEAMRFTVAALSLSGVTVNTGTDDDSKVLPLVICMADNSGEEEIKDTGNWHVNASVVVNSSANDETLATHRTRVQNVHDALINDSIAATLSAAVVDFFVFDVTFKGMENIPEQGHFSTKLTMDILCCASDVT